MEYTGYDLNLSNGYDNDLGVLRVERPQRAGGKKMFTWSFEARGTSTKPVTIEVFLIEANGLAFKAVATCLPEDMIDSDLERLRQRVKQHLMEQASLLTDVVWEDWLEVSVQGKNSNFNDSSRSSMGAALTIGVTRLKRGLHPKTGAPLTINFNGSVVPFPQASSLKDGPEMMGVGNRQMKIKEGEERSYIPATPQNLAALEEIMRRLGQLRSHLAEFLNQEQVQERLMQLDQLLPRIEGPEKT